MLIRVFRAVPSLAIKKIDKNRHGDATSSEQAQGSRDRLDWMERENGSQENAEEDIDALVPKTITRQPIAKTKPNLFQRLKNHANTMKVGCQIYFRQTVALPGMSLACLYFTVLSFGSITTGYIYTQNISESILSILRGVGSLLGILATFVFPTMRNSLGLVRSGLFSMSAQFTCMVICLIAVFTPGSPFFALPDSWRFHGSTVTIHNIHNVTEGNCSLSINTSQHYNVIHGYLNQLQAINDTIVNTSTSLYTIPYLKSTIVNTSTSLHTIPYLNSTIGSTSLHIKSSSYSVISTSTASHTLSMLLSPSSTIHIHTSSVATSPSSSVIPSPSPSSTVPPSPTTLPRTINCTVDEVKKKHITYNFSYASISLLIAGIVISRFGLWLSDLCITQLQQETVPEEERGIVGAMQKAFNSVLDMSMYVFVIALPKPEQFGIMAIMSVAAVGIGGVLYARFAHKSRGHLFHFDKIKRVLVRAGSGRRSTATNQPRASSLENLTNPEDDEEDEMLNEVLTSRNENFSR